MAVIHSLVENCEHKGLSVEFGVDYVQETKRHYLKVWASCAECNAKFRFIGLPAGLDLDGASVSVDGLVATLAIAPKGEVITPIEGIQGFTVRRTE